MAITPDTKDWTWVLDARAPTAGSTPRPSRLKAVAALGDPGHEAWALLGEEREDAFATWKLLAGLP